MIRWYLCGTCGQSCQAVYNGVPRCLRCSSSRWLARIAISTALVVTACDATPFAAPVQSVPCHGYPPDTVIVGLDTTIVLRAHKCGMPYLP